MTSSNLVFHEGERAVQQRAGAAGDMAAIGAKMIRPFMPEQHRKFFSHLPFVVLGLLDHRGRPWSTLVFGAPGFAQSSDQTSLSIKAQPLLLSELKIDYRTGAKIGMLGIELETRRRNRVNGTIIKSSENQLDLRVDQSFGNCPKYIQTRHLTARAINGNAFDAEHLRCTQQFSDDSMAIIETADTFFIASRSAQISGSAHAGIDASHRGGKPGFVRIIDDDRLIFPDFSGNRFFNTLGNITLDSRVGMLFPNFASGDAVFATGRASIVWDDALVSTFTGAERLIEVQLDEILFAPVILPLCGELLNPSPFLARTGIWEN